MASMVKKVLLLCISVSMGIAALPPSQEKGNPSTALSLLSRYGFSPIRLPKIPNKPAELVWKQIGATHYGYDGTGGSGNEAWLFQSRDTTIYNGAGNVVIWKASKAKTGWAADSLESLDSTIYIGNLISENVFLNYYYSPKLITSGYRYTCNYFDNGKSVALVSYRWKDADKSWVPDQKDTIFFSTPFSNYTNFYATIIRHNSYKFDTSSSSWTFAGDIAKIDPECNATTLVMGGKGSVNYEKDTLEDIKYIYVFKTSNWSDDNFMEFKIQVKNSSTNDYEDFSKSVFTPSCVEEYYWNATSKAWVCTSKDFNFVDAHANDTLSFYCYYDTNSSSWDTLSMNRFARTYTAEGNNDTTVQSYYSPIVHAWQLSSKDVNLFAQLDLPVAHPVVSQPKAPVSMAVTCSHIRFSAPRITALKLYTAAGRLVAVVRQEPASAISLRFSDCPVRISSGVYIAEIESGYGKRCFMAAIRR